MSKVLLAIGGAAIGLLSVPYLKKLFRKNVFVSYRYNGERAMRRLLKAWAKNKNFKKFDFSDCSADISIPSDDEDVIRNEISKHIQRADVLLVLIGADTHKGDWVNWEIATAKSFGIPIIAVKRHPSLKSPSELLSCGTNWVNGFKFESIRSALKKV